ncbi:hypothetical protein O1611_g1065 [Lasiodiplodia mahajangana]|uniref:Uncharacterized protein n=1 Tax=Lasiodiplodia mahajangana TaxID=1108764 RepID=A0ACC2JYH2_9PEZI|nr:hypothetical protein O1611_g1065 [Lasiodiplodia mahajangana]
MDDRVYWDDATHGEEAVLQQATSRATTDPVIRLRDRILLRMRTDVEGEAQRAHHAYSAFHPSVIDFASGYVKPWESDAAALGCLNTTVALYVSEYLQQRFSHNVAINPGSWLWRRWFQPYITDLELDRAFVKIFILGHRKIDYNGPETQTQSLIGLHCNVCEQSERMRDVACLEESPGSDSRPLTSGPLRSLPWEGRPASEARGKLRRSTRLLQPLFRAVFMVCLDSDTDITWPTDHSQIAGLRAQLILTGITEGLSAPISFEEIQAYSIRTEAPYMPGDQTIITTLDIATKFISRLEQREIAAFGIQPDICSLITNISSSWIMRYLEEASARGWIEESVYMEVLTTYLHEALNGSTEHSSRND